MRVARCRLSRCREVLTIDTDGNGRTITVCKSCERNKAGFCRECPRRMEKGPGWRNIRFRCDRCTRRHEAELKHAAYHRDPEHFRELRRRSNAKPDVRARMLAKHREWLKTHPQTPRTKAERRLHRLYHKAWRAKFFSDPANRERRRQEQKRRRQDPAYRARLNEKQRAYRRRVDRPDLRRAAEERRELVLAGKVRRLTARDRRWLAEAARPIAAAA
jgi:hypothetical protein